MHFMIEGQGLIHLQKHAPMCNLGKKSDKESMTESAACKHITTQYQKAFLFAMKAQSSSEVSQLAL